MGQKLRILELLSGNEGLTVKDIAVKLGLNEKTVRNRLAELTRSGLVARKGRATGVYLTQWGNLVALLARIARIEKGEGEVGIAEFNEVDEVLA